MSISIVWSVFTEKDDIRKVAKCFYCKKWFSFKVNTSGLIRHLKTVHGVSLEKLYENPSFRDTMEYSRAGMDTFRKQQAKMIVSCGLPFSIVENGQFRKFLQMLREDVPIISSDTARNDTLALENDYRNMIRAEFRGKKNLVLIMDGWSSTNALFQLYSIVISYMDNSNKMRQQLVGVTDVSKASAINLHRLVSEELLKSDICITQFKYMVSDGGSNLKSLSERLGIARVYCGAHLLHLVMVSVSDIAEVKQILSKCKKIAGILSKSTKSKNSMKEKAQELNINIPLPQNYSPTRWNGSRDLMVSVKSHIPTIAALPVFAECMFSNKEALLMDYFVEISGPFQQATKRFENTNSSCSELVPFFILIKRNVNEVYQKFMDKDDIKEHMDLCNSLLKIRRKMDEQVSERLNTMMKQNLLKVSCLLDPRFSGSHILPEEEWDSIEQFLMSQFSDDVSHIGDSDPVSSHASSSVLTSMNSLLTSGGTDRVVQMTEKQKAKKELIMFKQLIEQFPLRDVESDVLAFWKEKRLCLPLLSQKALEILLIPSSSSSTERIFSGASRLMANRLRNRITVETCSSLLLVNAMIGFEKYPESNEEYGVLNGDMPMDSSLEEKEEEEIVEEGEEGNVSPVESRDNLYTERSFDVLDFGAGDNYNIPGTSNQSRSTRIPRVQKPVVNSKQHLKAIHKRNCKK